MAVGGWGHSIDRSNRDRDGSGGGSSALCVCVCVFGGDIVPVVCLVMMVSGRGDYRGRGLVLCVVVGLAALRSPLANAQRGVVSDDEAGCVRDTAAAFLVYPGEKEPACSSFLSSLVAEAEVDGDGEVDKDACCAQLVNLEARQCLCNDDVRSIIEVAIAAQPSGDASLTENATNSLVPILGAACEISFNNETCAPPPPLLYDNCAAIADVLATGEACGPGAFDDGAVGAETDICCRALETMATENCLCREGVKEFLEAALTPATFYSTITAAYGACASLQLNPLQIGNTCPIDLVANDTDLEQRCLELSSPVLDEPTYACDTLLDGRCSSPFICDGGEDAWYERLANCCDVFREMNTERCFCRNDPSLRRALVQPAASLLSLEDAERRRFLFERLTSVDADFTEVFCRFALNEDKDECEAGR